MERMCAQTRPWFILLSDRVCVANGVRTHVNSKNPLYRRLRESNLRRCITQDNKPNALLTAIPAPRREIKVSELAASTQVDQKIPK